MIDYFTVYSLNEMLIRVVIFLFRKKRAVESELINKIFT